MAYVKDMVIEDSEGNKYYNGLNPTKVIKNLNDNAAITEEGYTPDALVTKTLIQNLAQGQIEFDVDATGKGFYRKRGADTWLPFSNALVLMDGTGSYAFDGINNGESMKLFL